MTETAKESAPIDPSELHAQVKELHNKPVRMFQFIDDEGIYSKDSLFGFLELDNRRVKVRKEGSSKKQILTNEEVTNLEEGDEVLIRWPIKVAEKYYEYPAMVMPPMYMQNKATTMQEHTENLVRILGLSEKEAETLAHMTKDENIGRFREEFQKHIAPTINQDVPRDALNEEYEFMSYQDMLKEREESEEVQQAKIALAAIHPHPENIVMSDELVEGTERQIAERHKEIKAHAKFLKQEF